VEQRARCEFKAGFSGAEKHEILFSSSADSYSTKENPFYGTKFSSACEWKRDEIESLCKSSDIIFYPSLCDSIVTFNRRKVFANVFIVTLAHLLASEWVKRAACELETRSDPLLHPW